MNVMTVSNPSDADFQSEWLETNGIGGFASSTVTGMNTRRYHGLLMAATKPPAGRMLLLSKLEETLIVNGQRFDLSTNQFHDSLHPRGYQYLTEFRLDPTPVWSWEASGARVVKTLTMPQGENTVVITYEITGPDCSLEIRPLIAFRDFHSTTHAIEALDHTVAVEPALASVQPYEGLPRLFFSHNADDLNPTGYWYYGFEYEREKERGLDFTEDLYNPFTLHFSGSKATITASTQSPATTNPPPEPPMGPGLIPALTRAASQFIVNRGELKSVIAGYHWFGDWGRDTMISLPGLTLATGRPEVARNILLAFAGVVDKGMLPNRFPDSGEAPEYNTVDATLWFFEAIRSYAHHTGDLAFVREHLYKTLQEIVDWHIRGTRFNIHVDENGLLICGEGLTWMDARVDSRCITGRSGKPVEIQALWYNALRILQTFAKAFDDAATQKQTGELADRALRSFNKTFWNEQADCLYDTIDPDDSAIRPSQVIAASLHHIMLPLDRTTRMLTTVERELLTPVGLRTLSPQDSCYCPRYEGGPTQRDAAYHQGTVWPWLIGPFITAYMKANGGSPGVRDAARQRAQGWLDNFIPHLREAGLGQVSEIFDGDAPHTPRGCIAQAWSVAELLRVAFEDLSEDLTEDPDAQTK